MPKKVVAIERRKDLRDYFRIWGTSLSTLGTAIIGLGAILLAFAAFWPGPNGGSKVLHMEDERKEQAV